MPVSAAIWLRQSRNIYTLPFRIFVKASYPTQTRQGQAPWTPAVVGLVSWDLFRFRAVSS